MGKIPSLLELVANLTGSPQPWRNPPEIRGHIRTEVTNTCDMHERQPVTCSSGKGSSACRELSYTELRTCKSAYGRAPPTARAELTHLPKPWEDMWGPRSMLRESRRHSGVRGKLQKQTLLPPPYRAKGILSYWRRTSTHRSHQSCAEVGPFVPRNTILSQHLSWNASCSNIT